MKLAFMSYDIAMHEQVMEILEDCGLKAYTRFEEVQGMPQEGHPRLGTQIWPGINTALIVPLPEDSEERLLERIGEFNSNARFEGVALYTWTLDHMLT